ncbi:unnamed protein product [Effrenium voratum]|nr:unnamed protein product [Effrenium voratum]
MATLQTLEAFEAYAAELFPLVGAEVLEQALQRLLKGNGHKALISLESLDGPAAVRWCLDGLRQPQPWQPVARVTVLEALSVDDDIRLPLDEAPALLAFAPEPVAKRFGQVLVSLLSEEEAGSWLKSLGQCAIESRKFQTASEGTSLDGTEALRAYARGTAAVLRQFPREAYCCLEELLEALFAVKAVHFTPVRLVLEALASSESGDLEPAQALDLAQRFFSSEMLLRSMPNSVRQMLASLFLRVLVRLCVTSRDCPESGSLVAKVATTLAVIPDDALLAPLQSLLGSLVQSWLQLDADASAACAGMFLKGLLSAEDQTKPMEACQQTLGLVRLLWALQGEALFLRLVCPVLAEAVRDMHRRSYLPRRVAVCALLLAAYGAQMLKQDSDVMDSDCLEEILSYVENQAMLAMGQGRPEAVVQEAPWVWLYALVLEMWHPRRASQVLPKALEKLRREEPREPAETLGLVAAASLLGAVAHMAEEKSAAFLALLRFQAPGKPSGVVDSRFGIGVKEDLGQWQRSRLEEYEDLQRIQHEGLGRVQEWRDASSVVLVAKWRALAQIVRCKDFESQDLGPEVVAEVLEELDSLQAPHVAYWAVVARRLYPLYFAEADGEKQDMLERLCRSIRGFISQSVGDGAVYMARGCLLELAAALCDLRQAEVRLKSSSVTQAVRELLALGELGTGVSRAVVTPLLSTLLAEATAPDCEDGARQSAADLTLTSLLVHSEYTIKDGALCHSAKLCAGALDPSGPAGAAALHGAVDGAEKLCEKFGGTPALPRILALAALDGLAQRSPGVMPGILREILTRLLAMLRKELQSILDRPGGANKPLTPMPLSPVHRLQLRGWQAVLILGCHADDDTVAELLPELFWHLRTPHLPDVRDYQELLGCVLSRRFQDLAVKHLVDCLAVYDCNNQVSASLLVIASFLFLHWSTEGSPLAGQLLKAVAPYLGHNSAYVRGTAAWGFFELMEAGASKDPMLVELHRFLVSNRECQKMRRRLRPVFQAYDTSKSALEALTDLAEVLPRTSDAAILQPLNIFADGDFKPSQSFLTLVKDEVAQEMDEIFEEEDFTQYASSSEHWQEAQMAALRVQLSPGEEPEPARVDAAGGVSGLQRKFVPPAPPRLQGAVGPAAQRAPLVVIASLVDKIPNLAGLCRTCEVFHCEALCLPNLKVTSEQAFQSISVTAEKWLPLRGVPRKDLRAQLLELRHRGYTLLGVEQTHTSVPLDQWEFTEHTAILLGAEKEGIDAELLPLLDGCVEIPQQGQLRSLNVHVSGSIVVWEYVRQARRRH